MRCVRCETELAFEVGVTATLTSATRRRRDVPDARHLALQLASAGAARIVPAAVIVDAGDHAGNTLLVPFLAAQRRALAQLGVLGIDWSESGEARPSAVHVPIDAGPATRRRSATSTG